MSDITKIKVNGELESSYKIFSKNREFEKRAECHPDWNQNNVSTPDYVKNRTHWTEPEILDVIFQQDDVALHDASDFLEANQLLVLSEELVVGDTYNVNIDGVDHYVVCYTNNSDKHFLGKESTNPFMLFGSGGSAKLYLYNFNYGSTVRLTVTHITPQKIHKLDPKYLPDADLEIRVNENYPNNPITANNMQITVGSVEDVCAKLANGDVPKVVIRYFRSTSPGYSDIAYIAHASYILRYGESLTISYIIGEYYSGCYLHSTRFRMNGTLINSEQPKKLAFDTTTL